MSIILIFSIVLPYPLGVLAGFAYTLVHDGFNFWKFRGQSIGKWIFQLKVVQLKMENGKVVQDDTPCTIRESAIRNAPLGVAVFFGIIPFWGWILLVLLGIPLVALEIYLMITLENGGRLGDVMADTRVVEALRGRLKPSKAL